MKKNKTSVVYLGSKQAQPYVLGVKPRPCTLFRINHNAGVHFDWLNLCKASALVLLKNLHGLGFSTFYNPLKQCSIWENYALLFPAMRFERVI